MTEALATHYDVLGLLPDASIEDIRRAYRRKVRQWAPDLNPSPEAHERMSQINEAYECLRDADRRAAYDRDPRTRASTPPREPRVSLRVVPNRVDLGSLAPGDSRLVEVDLYADGLTTAPEVHFRPEQGEDWAVVKADAPNDGSGRYLVMAVLITASRADAADAEARVIVDLEVSAASFTINWRVEEVLAAPPQPQPPPAAGSGIPSSPTSHSAPPTAPWPAPSIAGPSARAHPLFTPIDIPPLTARNAASAERGRRLRAELVWWAIWLAIFISVDWAIIAHYAPVALASPQDPSDGNYPVATVLGYSSLPLGVTDLVLGILARVSRLALPR